MTRVRDLVLRLLARSKPAVSRGERRRLERSRRQREEWPKRNAARAAIGLGALPAPWPDGGADGVEGHIGGATGADASGEGGGGDGG